VAVKSVLTLDFASSCNLEAFFRSRFGFDFWHFVKLLNVKNTDFCKIECKDTEKLTPNTYYLTPFSTNIPQIVGITQ
jgi:hypothetical protein